MPSLGELAEQACEAATADSQRFCASIPDGAVGVLYPMRRYEGGECGGDRRRPNSPLGKRLAEEPRARIASWREQPGMLGLRYGFLGDPARRWLHDGTLDWLWAAAEGAGVPIAALATDSLRELGRIAERHPGLRLTIDHLGGRGGTTTLKDAAAMTHIPELLALAKFPNVAVKATGVPGYSAEAYPFPAMHIWLRQIYDAFGPHRMFWGTDITKMPCSWRQCVTMFTEELSWLSDQDKKLVMGDALCAWWGWQRPA